MAGGNTRPTEEESATALLIRATEILERVVGDPRGLRAETEALVAESRAAGDWAALVAALRALAEAHRLLHEHELAVPLLDEAVRVARRHGYDGRLGEALLTRGILRLELGDPAGAGRDLDRAAALLENRDSGVEADIQRAALAQNLDVHTRALDAGDAAAAREHGLYERIAHSLRAAADDLRAAASEMASAVDLPMGVHNMEAITTTDVLRAFDNYVAASDDLRLLLDARREEDEQMLSAIRAEVGSRDAG